MRIVGVVVVLSALLGASACSKKEGRRVTGWEPKAGPYTGGGTVILTGNELDQTGVKVYFGDKVANTLYTAPDTIKVEAPPGDIGKTVDIDIRFDDSKSLKIDQAYTYEDTQKDLSVDGLVDGKSGPGAPGSTPTPGGATPPAPPPAPTPTPTPTPAPEGATPPP